MRRGLIGGGVLAVLWFICGWVPQLLAVAGGSLATLGGFIPSPMRWAMLGHPPVWAIAEQALMAVVLVGGFALLTSSLAGSNLGRGSGRGAFVVGWLAAVLLSFVIGAALDVGLFVSAIGWSGIRGAGSSMGVAMATTWWAVVVGWLPALVFARLGSVGRGAAGAVRSEGADAAAAAGSMTPRRVLAIAVALALVALPLVSEGGRAAVQDQLRQDQAIAEEDAQQLADPFGAAARDPEAQGDPVPPAADAEGAAPEDACTTEDTIIMASQPDGATGHRGQALTLTNVSQEPCAVEGYPDIAYGDQNGHLLEVTVEHGRSFMGEDPGPSTFTLQPGETASAVIGWDANSVHGQLAARSLWTAVRPGEPRRAQDVAMDIVPGATVHVTAWSASGLAG